MRFRGYSTLFKEVFSVCCCTIIVGEVIETLLFFFLWLSYISPCRVGFACVLNIKVFAHRCYPGFKNCTDLILNHGYMNVTSGVVLSITAACNMAAYINLLQRIHYVASCIHLYHSTGSLMYRAVSVG